MDDETLNVLKTVCAAGGARAGFNGNSNARMEQLVRAGLLDVVHAGSTNSGAARFRPYYRPTEEGKAIYRQLIGKGAA